MAKFCNQCGRELVDGQVCVCQQQNAQTQQTQQPQQPQQQTASPENRGSRIVTSVDSKTVTIDTGEIKSALGSLKDRMGLGDPLANQGDAFEKGKKIVPDVIKTNESEVPIKQYEIATLRNRILGIPYTKAKGRIQVTNKRVIFRAPGICMAGRTTLQHEFEIDEISGIEARREFKFEFWSLILAILFAGIGGAVFAGIFGGIGSGEVNNGILFFTSLIAIVSIVPFFLIKRLWLVKAIILGAGAVPAIAYGVYGVAGGSFYSESSTKFLGVVSVIFGVIAAIILLVDMFIYAIRPNLVLSIKTSGAQEAIDIKAEKKGLFAILGIFSREEDAHTGFEEIFPEEDAEISIREIGAMISDIKKLGDYGIEKWKVD